MKQLSNTPSGRPGNMRLRHLLAPLALFSVPASHAATEANLVLPNLADPALGTFLGGLTGWQLLAAGLLVCLLGLAFGCTIYRQVKAMPTHRSMAEVSELIYETCKT